MENFPASPTFVANSSSKRLTGFCLTIWCLLLAWPKTLMATDGELEIEVFQIARGSETWDWTQARTAHLPNHANPLLTTFSRTKRTGSHGYYDIFMVQSDRSGVPQGPPTAVPALVRTTNIDGVAIVPGDLWPKYHRRSGKILITGKTFNFEQGSRENYLLERVAYAVLDPESLSCGGLQLLSLPSETNSGAPLLAANAGCHQRVDLLNGDILLPIRYQTSASKRIYTSSIALCQFDGQHLTFVKHGSQHSVATGRGLYEPSLIQHGTSFYLTMRADDGAFVCRSSDGLHFDHARPWRFDDGQPLGSYNTQQHWMVLGEQLYLLYTRAGANNDHVFRHRAPLFIAEVDTDALVVKKSTERILVPENHATLGNFGVCQISDKECWVTVAEGRVAMGARKTDVNRVLAVRVTKK